MDFETSDMEFEIKDEVKEEIIDEILKGAQEAIENANLELKADDGIDTKDIFCPSPPPTCAVELNAVETEFDGRPEKRPRNFISKARVICPHCPKSFPTSKALQKHSLNLHTVEENNRVEFRCVTCAGRKFNDQKSRDEHLKQYHISNFSVLLSQDPSLLECLHCPRLFLVQKDLNAHVESEHTDPLEIDPLSTTTPSIRTETTLEISTTRHKHKCPHCSFAFLLSQSLQEHIIKIHVKHKAFPCHICANLKKAKVESFIDKQSLDQHIKSCHAHVREGEPALKELPKCPHCDKTFSRKSHLAVHIKTVHAEPQQHVSVKCPHCPLTFTRDFNLRQHIIKRHVKHITFPCHICASLKKPQIKSFISQKSLDLHLRRCHSPVPEEEPAESRLKCPQCEKTYSQKSHLADHIKDIHNGPGLWEQCPQCPLFFTCNEALKSHVISWHKEPCENNESEVEPGLESQQKCPHCDITLTGKSSLAVHIELVHSESQPCIKCPHCPFVFLRSQNLQEHITKLHVRDKVFPCPCHICANLNKSKVESFIDKQSLDRHIKTCHSHVREKETAESRLKCPHCDKTYSRKGHLTYHIKFTHSGPVSRIQCPQCPLSSAHNTGLRMHCNNCGNKHCESTGGETEAGAVSLPKCPHCDITLSGKSSLAALIRQVHSESQPRIKCPHCPFTFARNQARKIHINKFHKDKEHNNIDGCGGEREPETDVEPLLKCFNCDATFPQESLLSLKQHVQQEHSSSRPGLKCPCCPITFAHKMTLKNHFVNFHKEHSKNCQGETETTATVGQDSRTKSPPCCDDKCNGSICITEYINKLHKETLKCPQCPLTLSSSQALKIHVMRVHERNKAFPCPKCKNCNTSKIRLFPSRAKLNQHMRLYHDSTSLQNCPHCNINLRTKWHLRNHLLLIHSNVPEPEQLPECNIRDQQYTLMDNLLRKPLLGKQVQVQSKCRYCNKTFLNARELRNHIIEMHVKQKNKTGEGEVEPSTSRVQCPKCPSTFSNSKHLQFHTMLLHAQKEEFPCLICTSRDQGSSNPESGLEMKSQHYIFEDEISLNQHMKNIHYSTHTQNQNLPEPEKVHIVIPKNKICPICSKSFDGMKYAASNYRSHMETHLDIKRYSCEHCSKKFATKLSLHSHLIRYHNYSSEQLNFKNACKLCPFITTSQLVLNYHMGVKHPNSNDGSQSGEEMNVETAIESNFSRATSRNINSEINPAESAVCFVCLKIQTTKSNLIQHLKEHRGEGRFYCDLCPRDYSLRMSLLIHLRLDHHKLAYCSKCFTSFSDAAELNQHCAHIDGAAVNSNLLENENSRASNLRCETCNTICKSPCLFKIHTISHLKERQQQELNFAEDEVVSADKIFKCNVCPKVFDRQSYLNAHLEIVHENPQESSRFQCDKCERNYKFVSELKYHDLVVHSLKINQEVNPNHSAAADGEFDFKCDICLTKFGTESELTDHQDKFRSEFLCHICPAKFKCKTALKLHLKRVHRTDNYSYKHLCHICPSKFFNGKELRLHVERVHEAKNKKRRWYESDERNIDHQSETLRECNNSNNKVSDVLLGKKPEIKLIPQPSRGRNKNKAKITNKSVMCFVCSEMQSNKGNLMIHLKEHRGERRAYCDLCPRDYLDRFYLMAHLKWNHHRLANCNKCFTSFADNEALNQHLLHVDVPTLNSNQTTESQASENADPLINDADSPASLNENSPASTLKCEICGESSKSPCLFKIHSISHLKEIQQQELNFPDDVVSVDNIFKCSLCPSAFDRQSYLNAHLNIVHESSPESNHFECGKCEQAYKTQNELKFHDLVVHSLKINRCVINPNQNHTSEVSDAKLAFECSTCSSKFATQSELSNHEDIFEPKLSCHICSTKFKCKFTLKSHVRFVHGSKHLVCGICHLAKFSRLSDLRTHVREVHEGKRKKRIQKKGSGKIHFS